MAIYTRISFFDACNLTSLVALGAFVVMGDVALEIVQYVLGNSTTLNTLLTLLACSCYIVLYVCIPPSHL